jgi:hypothetical protein
MMTAIDYAGHVPFSTIDVCHRDQVTTMALGIVDHVLFLMTQDDALGVGRSCGHLRNTPIDDVDHHDHVSSFVSHVPYCGGGRSCGRWTKMTVNALSSPVVFR